MFVVRGVIRYILHYSLPTGEGWGEAFSDVSINAEDRASINQYLSEDVQHRLMDLTRRRHQQRDEGQENTASQQRYGCPFFYVCLTHNRLILMLSD